MRRSRSASRAVVEVDRVDQLAVDVELQLVRRARCRSAPARSAVALEVLEYLLLELRAAVDPVHDLERPCRPGRPSLKRSRRANP